MLYQKVAEQTKQARVIEPTLQTLLDITGIKASFVLTDFQKKIYISARSIDEIDVQMIMERMGGGGHLNFAGAQIEGMLNEEVYNSEDAIANKID